MGVYGTTLRGELLPPLYILSTALLKEEDYKIDPRVCVGLPTVMATYGAETEMTYSLKFVFDTRVQWIWGCGINSNGIYIPLFQWHI